MPLWQTEHQAPRRKDLTQMSITSALTLSQEHQNHRFTNLGPLWNHLGIFKTSDVGPVPQVRIQSRVWPEHRDFFKAPRDSKLQKRVRTTDLRDREGKSPHVAHSLFWSEHHCLISCPWTSNRLFLNFNIFRLHSL